MASDFDVGRQDRVEVAAGLVYPPLAARTVRRGRSAHWRPVHKLVRATVNAQHGPACIGLSLRPRRVAAGSPEIRIHHVPPPSTRKPLAARAHMVRTDPGSLSATTVPRIGRRGNPRPAQDLRERFAGTGQAHNRFLSQWGHCAFYRTDPNKNTAPSISTDRNCRDPEQYSYFTRYGTSCPRPRETAAPSGKGAGRPRKCAATGAGPDRDGGRPAGRAQASARRSPSRSARRGE